jgi:hypothetical protein
MTDISRRSALAGAAAAALMPFVKTTPASAAAPLAEKQNASFYRYNVGTHQVTVVCDGVATINLPDNYAPAPRKRTSARSLPKIICRPTRSPTPSTRSSSTPDPSSS